MGRKSFKSYFFRNKKKYNDYNRLTYMALNAPTFETKDTQQTGYGVDYKPSLESIKDQANADSRAMRNEFRDKRFKKFKFKKDTPEPVKKQFAFTMSVNRIWKARKRFYKLKGYKWEYKKKKYQYK